MLSALKNCASNGKLTKACMKLQLINSAKLNDLNECLKHNPFSEEVRCYEKLNVAGKNRFCMPTFMKCGTVDLH